MHVADSQLPGVVGDALAVLISSVVEHFSESASLLVFLGLYAGVFVISWLVAVRITEKYFITGQ